jgi:hypothetical protein
MPSRTPVRGIPRHVIVVVVLHKTLPQQQQNSRRAERL